MEYTSMFPLNMLNVNELLAPRLSEASPNNPGDGHSISEIPGEELQSFKRRKVKIACENCRSKKKKCDGRRPVCSACKVCYDKKIIARLKVQTKSSLPNVNDQSRFNDITMPHCVYRFYEESNSHTANCKEISPHENAYPANGVTPPTNSAIVSNLEIPSFHSSLASYAAGANIHDDINHDIPTALDYDSSALTKNNLLKETVKELGSKVENLTKLIETNNRFFNNTRTDTSNTLIAATLQELVASFKQFQNKDNLDKQGMNDAINQQLNTALTSQVTTPSEVGTVTSSVFTDPNSIINRNIAHHDSEPRINKLYFSGYWDRSVERVLRWPIFDGKYDQVEDIKTVMQSRKHHIFHNPPGVSRRLELSFSDDEESDKSDGNGTEIQNKAAHQSKDFTENREDNANKDIDSPSSSSKDSDSMLRIDNIIDSGMSFTNVNALLNHDNSYQSQISSYVKESKHVSLESLPSLNLHNFQLLTKLEPVIVKNLSKWISDFILNVHTSGNLFLNLTNLRNTADHLVGSYKEFLISQAIKFKLDDNGDIDYDTIENINRVSFLLNYCSYENTISADEDNTLEKLRHMPLYIILATSSVAILSSRYNRKNSRISNYKSSVLEKQDHHKSQLAFQLYELSVQFKYLVNSNLIVTSGIDKKKPRASYVNKELKRHEREEFYSLWNIQFYLLLSLYKNYMLRPLEAFNHIQTASSLIITFLELNKRKFLTKNNHSETFEEEYFQLVQRLYWQSHKNETELKLYLSPIYCSSGIISYKPPFKIRDLKIPNNTDQEERVVKDGWAFYLTEIFVRPILNKIMDRFYLQSLGQENEYSLEKYWADLSQHKFVELIQGFLKETGDLLKIFEKFLNQQKLSTPLRCADERVIRIKECLCLPLLYHISTVVPLPMPNYTTAQLKNRPTNYQNFLHPYIISFLKDLCDQYLRIPDLIDFASERRHGTWYRLRDIYLAALILMIIYKKFGIYFFTKAKLTLYIEQTNTIFKYWEEECPELSVSAGIINSIYNSLPYIDV